MYNLKPFILILILIFSILTSIGISYFIKMKSKKLPTQVEEIGRTDAVTLKDIEITRLTHEVDHGLNLVQVNDTLNLLIYRGVESVSMIQIK